MAGQLFPKCLRANEAKSTSHSCAVSPASSANRPRLMRITSSSPSPALWDARSATSSLRRYAARITWHCIAAATKEHGGPTCRYSRFRSRANCSPTRPQAPNPHTEMNPLNMATRSRRNEWTFQPLATSCAHKRAGRDRGLVSSAVVCCPGSGSKITKCCGKRSSPTLPRNPPSNRSSRSTSPSSPGRSGVILRHNSSKPTAKRPSRPRSGASILSELRPSFPMRQSSSPLRTRSAGGSIRSRQMRSNTGYSLWHRRARSHRRGLYASTRGFRSIRRPVECRTSQTSVAAQGSQKSAGRVGEKTELLAAHGRSHLQWVRPPAWPTGTNLE